MENLEKRVDILEEFLLKLGVIVMAALEKQNKLTKEQKMLNPSEALFGFAGWLTSRKEKTVLSSSDNAAPIADLVNEFIKTNNLPEVREGWDKELIHPKS